MSAVRSPNRSDDAYTHFSGKRRPLMKPNEFEEKVHELEEALNERMGEVTRTGTEKLIIRNCRSSNNGLKPSVSGLKTVYQSSKA